MVAPTVPVRFTRNPDVVLREEDEDGALLFNADTAQVKVLNTTALAIWKLCDGQHGIPEIAQVLTADFDEAEPTAVARDVEGFLELLVGSGFVQEERPAASA